MQYREFNPNEKDYIEITLDKSNTFFVNISFEILGKRCSNIKAKIDTGSTYTRICAAQIGINPEEAYQLKINDYNNPNIPHSLSQSANSTELEQFNERIQRDCNYVTNIKTIVFNHTAHNITINGMYIGDTEFKVSYDYDRPLLLGMDILKKFDIHIHQMSDGKTILLACPLYCISKAYRQKVLDLIGN